MLCTARWYHVIYAVWSNTEHRIVVLSYIIALSSIGIVLPSLLGLLESGFSKGLQCRATGAIILHSEREPEGELLMQFEGGGGGQKSLLYLRFIVHGRSCILPWVWRRPVSASASASATASVPATGLNSFASLRREHIFQASGLLSESLPQTSSQWSTSVRSAVRLRLRPKRSQHGVSVALLRCTPQLWDVASGSLTPTLVNHIITIL